MFLLPPLQSALSGSLPLPNLPLSPPIHPSIPSLLGCSPLCIRWLRWVQCSCHSGLGCFLGRLPRPPRATPSLVLHCGTTPPKTLGLPPKLSKPSQRPQMHQPKYDKYIRSPTLITKSRRATDYFPLFPHPVLVPGHSPHDGSRAQSVLC